LNFNRFLLKLNPLICNKQLVPPLFIAHDQRPAMWSEMTPKLPPEE
jgi:hypothetical protein